MVVFLELPGVGSIWIERTGHMPLRYVGRLRFKNSKKRFSNLNFGSFFWSFWAILGHFLVACGKIQPPKCTKKLPTDKIPLRRRNTPRGKTPNGFEAMRHCCRSREQDCGRGCQKGASMPIKKNSLDVGLFVWKLAKI